MIGFIALVLLSLLLSFIMRIRKDSALGLALKWWHFKALKKNIIVRFLMIFVFVSGFSIVLFNVASQILGIAIDSLLAIFAFIFFFIKVIFLRKKHNTIFKEIKELIDDFGEALDTFYEHVMELFEHGKFRNLGYSAILIMLIIADIGIFIIPYMTGMDEALYFSAEAHGHHNLWHLASNQIAGQDIFIQFLVPIIYALNCIAIIMLFWIIARYFWYHHFKNRTKPTTEKDKIIMPSWVIIITLTSLVAFLLTPAFGIQSISTERIAGVSITTQEILHNPILIEVFLASILIFAISFLIATRWHDLSKIILIYSSLTYFGYYSFIFMSSFIRFYINEFSSLLQSEVSSIILPVIAKPIILSQLAVGFFLTLMFYLLGVKGIIFELFITNELGIRKLFNFKFIQNSLREYDREKIEYAHKLDNKQKKRKHIKKAIERELEEFKQLPLIIEKKNEGHCS
jgi:hypothetical protein